MLFEKYLISDFEILQLIFRLKISAQSLSKVKNIVSKPWIFQSMSVRYIHKSRSCYRVGSLGFYSCLDINHLHNCHLCQNHNRWDHWTNRKYHLDTFHHNSQVNMDLSMAIFKLKLGLWNFIYEKFLTYQYK